MERDMMDIQLCDIGIIGLGTMGRNLALNIAEHDFSIAIFNRTPSAIEQLMDNKPDRTSMKACYCLQELIHSLKVPRAIILMIPAGSPIDEVIDNLDGLLETGDILIDGGNSYFKDTNRREALLAAKGIHYLGMGISGGDEGARFGPSIMVGGQPEAYLQVRFILERIAAQVENKPCAAYLGAHSAGHYVKMVHNAIEYGLMQLIAETYDLMSRGLGLSASELQTVYSDWNQTELSSFLLEITADIFKVEDELAPGYLIDKILDKAMQKGTGSWNFAEAMALQVPAPTLDISVTMRNLSALKKERTIASDLFSGPIPSITMERNDFIEHLRKAFFAGIVITFSQGMSQLFTASSKYGYHLPLDQIASIWRGGCIIRAQLLEKIRLAYCNQNELAHLLFDDSIRQDVEDRQASLRHIICTAVESGIPAPGFMSCISYFDSYRSAHLPVNLIQAQRDYFGAHSYERMDMDGQFHTQWKERI